LSIKKQIQECLFSTPSGRDFAFSSPTFEGIQQFRRTVTAFLDTRKHNEAVNRCREVYRSMLDIHDKYSILFPVIDNLNLDELYGTGKFSSQRLHFSHQANVFLLGLYIYHNFEELRKRIDSEMKRTTIEISRDPPYPPFRYSGGEPYGEFLYRWRVSSLCHDIGTGVQLCQGNEKEIGEILESLRFQKPVNNIRELCTFEKRDLRNDLDRANNISFSRYMQYQENHPFPDSLRHDHGIVGALIFLRKMNEAYSRNIKNKVTYNNDGTEVFWHQGILNHSILQIALCIGMHNLNNHPKALQESSTISKIFNLNRYPLAWLLKVADLLQEWDKPTIENQGSDPSTETDLAIGFSKSEIIVKNFPKEKK
jgi:hypothetical protein